MFSGNNGSGNTIEVLWDCKKMDLEDGVLSLPNGS
jgi:hypothetical protein